MLLPKLFACMLSLSVPVATTTSFVVLLTPPCGAQEPDDSKAKAHFQIAQAALSANDLETAGEELRKAISYSDHNALLRYNLAIIQSMQKKTADAKNSLELALRLGLQGDEKLKAEEMLATATYEIHKAARSELNPYLGRWVTHLTRVRERKAADCQNTYSMTISLSLALDDDAKLTARTNVSIDSKELGCPVEITEELDKQEPTCDSDFVVKTVEKDGPEYTLWTTDGPTGYLGLIMDRKDLLVMENLLAPCGLMARGKFDLHRVH